MRTLIFDRVSIEVLRERAKRFDYVVAFTPDEVLALASLVEAAEALKREVGFAILGAEPKDHREPFERTNVCPWVTPDCLWCALRRVRTQGDAALAALDSALGGDVT